mmetsp:Transcript_15937/g.37885  ORF Transcript_15937/g.37885 Transcript_15937/m.37885 type:complete len:302 (-) Transcript_15937:314-1219(-)
MCHWSWLQSKSVRMLRIADQPSSTHNCHSMIGSESSAQLQFAANHTMPEAFPSLSASVAIRLVSCPCPPLEIPASPGSSAARKSATTKVARALAATRTELNQQSSMQLTRNSMLSESSSTTTSSSLSIPPSSLSGGVPVRCAVSRACAASSNLCSRGGSRSMERRKSQPQQNEARKARRCVQKSTRASRRTAPPRPLARSCAKRRKRRAGWSARERRGSSAMLSLPCFAAARSDVVAHQKVSHESHEARSSSDVPHRLLASAWARERPSSSSSGRVEQSRDALDTIASTGGGPRCGDESSQ